MSAHSGNERQAHMRGAGVGQLDFRNLSGFEQARGGAAVAPDINPALAPGKVRQAFQQTRVPVGFAPLRIGAGPPPFHDPLD